MSNTNGFFDPSPSEVSISGNEVTINPGQDFDYSSDYYILTSSNLLYTTGTGNSYYAGINDSTTLNFTTVAAPDLMKLLIHSHENAEQHDDRTAEAVPRSNES